jgi:hypothetical protein
MKTWPKEKINDKFITLPDDGKPSTKKFLLTVKNTNSSMFLFNDEKLLIGSKDVDTRLNAAELPKHHLSRCDYGYFEKCHLKLLRSFVRNLELKIHPTKECSYSTN